MRQEPSKERKTIRVDLEVYAALQALAHGWETQNETLRRVLGLDKDLPLASGVSRKGARLIGAAIDAATRKEVRR